MSAKKYFEKQKNKQGARGLSKSSAADFIDNVESKKFVKEYNKNKEQFIPDVDYSKPENFVKFGLATKYYEDSIKRIYNLYPYDGSLAEQLEFYNNLTPLEKYIFNTKYPKSTGYAKFSPTGWGTATAVNNPATKEYIRFYGGPNTDNIYATASAHENNLKLDYSASGNTIEFWMKKKAFVAKNKTNKEVIFDLHTTASTNYIDHRQFSIYLQSSDHGTGGDSTKIHIVDKIKGNSPTTVLSAALDTGLTTIADNVWHHYAIVLDKSQDNNFISASLYVDNFRTDLHLSESFSHLSSWAPEMALASLGANITEDIGGSSGGTGWYKLSGSIDEFRFWKTARNHQQIGRNYFAPVGGGTNTDKSKYYFSSSLNKSEVDLGVYYKFNEGITGDSDTDKLVLDYSGRISNGTWVGYSSESRNTSSAIVQSGIFQKEEADPIIHSNHPKIKELQSNLVLTGSDYDAQNNGALYNTIPQWIREQDEESKEMSNLTQIMGSYLDTLYGQISYFTELKAASYLSGSVEQASAISKNSLRSMGFEVPELFVDADVLKEVFSRDDREEFQDKLFHIKNLIYKNIYNNLNYINKSKGTEKAFRNIFRCFGIDNELFKLKIYGDNVVHEIESTEETTTTKRKVIDFSGLQREADRDATVFQTPGSGSQDYGYVSASIDLIDEGIDSDLAIAGDSDIPITAEAEIIFPRFPKVGELSTLPSLKESALFGCHRVMHHRNSTNTTWTTPDRDFQVFAVKEDEERTYFKVSSSQGYFPTLTSSVYRDVYDNSKWNFAVRIRPDQYPWSSYVTSSLSASYEFYGVNVDSGIINNEFLVSSSISRNTAGFFTAAAHKKFFVGAHRQNFKGSVLQQSDVKVVSLRYWYDYLTDEEVQYHAKNPANYGRKNPSQNSHVWEGNIGFQHVPNIDTLALHWDFSVVSSSALDGTFLVNDISSASYDDRYMAAGFSSTVKNKHPGQGFGFDPNSTKIFSVEYVPTSRITSPENLLSSNMVQIISQDDEVFTRESRPSKNFFSIESSMYDIVSQNILNFFASIDAFNNLIGEPVHMYRAKYKNLEKLRQLFFERVQNVPDVDKFVGLYKWVDSALESVLMNLIPASANVSDQVRTVIESHVLERNKYRHKYAQVKEFVKIDNTTKLRSTQEGEAETTVDRSKIDENSFQTFPIPPTVVDNYDGAQLSVGMVSINGHQQSANKSAMRMRSEGRPGPRSRRDDVNPNSFKEKPEYVDNSAPTEQFNDNERPFEQDSSAHWWRERAERDRGVLQDEGENIGANTTRIQLWENMRRSKVTASYKQYEFSWDESQTLSSGPNPERTQSREYVRNKFKEGDVGNDGISASFNMGALNQQNEPYIHNRELTGSIRRVPLKAQDTEGNTGSYSEKRLPISIFSSSVNSGYQEGLNENMQIGIAIEDVHHDMYSEAHYEIPMQSPFAEEHAGGNQYRHGQLFKEKEAVSSGEDILQFGANLSRDHEFSIKVPKSILDGAEIPVRIKVVHSMVAPEDDQIVVLKGSSDSGSADNVLKAINGDSDTDVVLYGRDAGSPETGVAGIVALSGSSTKTLTLNAAREGLVGNEISVANLSGSMHEEDVAFSGGSDFRKEGFRISTGVNTIKIKGPRNIEDTYNKAVPSGMFYRDNVAKSPVLIKNIKHDGPPEFDANKYVRASNYKKEYEIIHTAGRKENNRYFTKNTGSLPEGKSVLLTWTDDAAGSDKNIIEYELPKRDVTGSNKHVFVNRYTNHGGVHQESEGYLDVESAEYSPYAALPYQNLVAKEALDELWKRHADIRGTDSHFGVVGTQSFHKNHRNAVLRPDTDFQVGDDVSEEVYDNYFVSHAIPRSDINYKWIKDSWIVQRTGSGNLAGTDPFVVPWGKSLAGVAEMEYLPLYGFDYTAEVSKRTTMFTGSELITFVSASDFGSYFDHQVGIRRQFGSSRKFKDNMGKEVSGFLPTTFVGINYNIYEPVVSSSNQLGIVNSYGFSEGAEDTTDISSSFINISLIQSGGHGASGRGILFGPESQGAAASTNALFLHRYGPYGWPTWKQIRGEYHPVIKFHRRNNIYEVSEEIYDVFRDRVKDFRTRIIQSPVTSKHKPIEHNFKQFGVKYDFGNNYHYFGTTYVSSSKDKKIADYNEKFGTKANNFEKSILFSTTKDESEVNWSSFKYSETIWPKDENVYRDIIRNKPLFVSSWDDELATRISNPDALPTTQNKSSIALTDFRTSVWPMDVELSKSTTMDIDTSGELMQYDNPRFVNDTGYSLNHLPHDIAHSADPDELHHFARYGRNYGKCRPYNQVQTQVGTGAFYNSYVDFASDIRLIGKDYSIIPEFKISKYVRDVAENYQFDFYQDIYELESTGSREFNKDVFFETYAQTDPITHLPRLKSNFGNPDAIKLTMKGILKLLPYDGFYPVQRTMNLAQQFSQSYGPRTAMNGQIIAGNSGSWQTVLNPFYGPGIMYNTIKSGVAVDYPIIDEETLNFKPPVPESSGQSDPPDACSMYYKKRLPFEAIVEPLVFSRKIRGSGSADFGHGVTDAAADIFNLKIYEHDTEIYSGSGMAFPGIRSTGTLAGTDYIYENLAHNFFAEVPNFFLKKLSSLTSKPEEEWVFKGPLSSSAGVRKFAMNIIVEKSKDFTMHDGAAYFGHAPYHHHLPSWYPLRDRVKGINGHYFRAACSGSDRMCYNPDPDAGLIPPKAGWSQNQGVAEILFDPKLIHDKAPERFFEGKFTLEDILSNSEITYRNYDLFEQMAGMEIEGGKGMALSASINFSQYDSQKRWLIGSKWETPVLNFVNVAADSLNGSGLGDTVSDPYRGMWHQFGHECSGSEGLFLKVTDIDGISAAERDLTGSLVQACGFSNDLVRMGDIKPQKVLEEAVVAIPYFIDNSEELPAGGAERFFEIPLDDFEQAYSDLTQAEEAARSVKRTGEEYVITINNSITDMIHKMNKYVMLPQYDFSLIRRKKNRPINSREEYHPAEAPFAMYIFEFNTILSRKDLIKIWQGVMPEISKTAEKQDISLSHPIIDGELISPRSLSGMELDGLPADIRWKIFKVKRKASQNYFEMLEEHHGLKPLLTERRKNSKNYSLEFGSNWPYDFCSLVELGKLDVSLQFDSEGKSAFDKDKEEQNRAAEVTIVDDSVDEAVRSEVKNSLESVLGLTPLDNTGHQHTYSVDEKGNGTAYMKCHPESEEVCHQHKIINHKVQSAASGCYPRCRSQFGVDGLAPHIHEIMNKGDLKTAIEYQRIETMMALAEGGSALEVVNLVDNTTAEKLKMQHETKKRQQKEIQFNSGATVEDMLAEQDAAAEAAAVAGLPLDPLGIEPEFREEATAATTIAAPTDEPEGGY